MLIRNIRKFHIYDALPSPTYIYHQKPLLLDPYPLSTIVLCLGTGKTFTMEGGEGRDEPGTTWENDPTAGIVPRFNFLIKNSEFKAELLKTG